MPRPPQPAPAPLPRPAPVPAAMALAVAVLCIGIEAALWGADAGLWGSAYWRPWAYQHGAFWAGLLRDWTPNYPGQPAAMFLTYAVLHGGPGHLAGNMIALWALMGFLGPRIDAGRLALIWIGASLGGGLGYALLSSGPQPMVGASGALFGLAGAWMVWDAAALARAGRSRWPILRSALIIAAVHPVLWIVLTAPLAWQTHLGGFLAGAALARVLGPAPGDPPPVTGP